MNRNVRKVENRLPAALRSAHSIYPGESSLYACECLITKRIYIIHEQQQVIHCKSVWMLRGEGRLPVVLFKDRVFASFDKSVEGFNDKAAADRPQPLSTLGYFCLFENIEP